MPVRVSTENGAIQPGDYLTASSKPGIAMKATRPGAPIVAQALAPWDNENEIGQVMSFLKQTSAPDKNISFTFASPKTTNGAGVDINTSSIETPHYEVDLLGAIGAIELLTGEQYIFPQGEENNLAEAENDQNQETTEEQPQEDVLEQDQESSEVSNLFRLEEETGSLVLANNLVTEEAVTMQNNLTVIGEIEAHADVTLYANLVVDTVHIAQALNVHGDTNLFGNLTVEGDTDIKGELSLSDQQAGTATISRGAKEVTVTYTKPFIKVPLVQVTPLSKSAQYWVSDHSQTGFTITLDQITQEDVTFTWTTLSVEAPTEVVAEGLDENQNGILDIDEGIEVDNTGQPEALQPSSNPEPTTTPSLEPSPTPSPALEPSPSPTATPAAFSEGLDSALDPL